MTEYSRVKIIVTRGETEVVYDIPKVEGFEVETLYDEPEIDDFNLNKKIPKIPRLKAIVFRLFPHSNGKSIYMTITRTVNGVKQ